MNFEATAGRQAPKGEAAAASAASSRKAGYTYTFAAERFTERRKHTVEGAPVTWALGFLSWLLLAMTATTWFVCQWIQSPIQAYARDWWWIFATAYTGLHVLHFLLTTRDGYIVSLTHWLKLPAFIRAHSTCPDPTCWLYQEQGTKWKLFFYNVCFWVLVMAMKVPFDYFIICLPLVDPLKLVFSRHWLGCNSEDWSTG